MSIRRFPDTVRACSTLSRRRLSPQLVCIGHRRLLAMHRQRPDKMDLRIGAYWQVARSAGYSRAGSLLSSASLNEFGFPSPDSVLRQFHNR